MLRLVQSGGFKVSSTKPERPKTAEHDLKTWNSGAAGRPGVKTHCAHLRLISIFNFEFERITLLPPFIII